jgi:hypothetical protein
MSEAVLIAEIQFWKRRARDAEGLLHELLSQRDVDLAGKQPSRYDLIDVGLLPTPPDAVDSPE